jgi:hypothetical protein
MIAEWALVDALRVSVEEWVPGKLELGIEFVSEDDLVMPTAEPTLRLGLVMPSHLRHPADHEE